jgi:DNA repair protein RadC
VDSSGHRKRLKERFIAAPEVMPDYEILEMLLFSSYPRQDTKPLAKELIKQFGSLAEVISASPEDLKNGTKLPDTAVATLKAVQQASLRLIAGKLNTRLTLGNWKAVHDYCQARMSFLTTEQFRVLYLNRQDTLLANEILSEGSVDQVPVYPRDIAQRALNLGASAVILVHNHPSGDPKPSKEDIDITRKLQQILAHLEITVHDHLIIGANTFYSFRNTGMM